MWLIKTLRELKSQYLLGLIELKRYEKELDKLLEVVDDEFSKQIINSYKDKDI